MYFAIPSFGRSLPRNVVENFHSIDEKSMNGDAVLQISGCHHLGEGGSDLVRESACPRTISLCHGAEVPETMDVSPSDYRIERNEFSRPRVLFLQVFSIVLLLFPISITQGVIVCV